MSRQSHHRGLRGLLTNAILLLGPATVHGYKLDPNSTESVTSIAKSMTKNMMSFYHGNEPGGTPGLLPVPYYWWEAGAMMGTLIDYWYYTGDDTYNDIVTEALLFQVGDDNDYMPRNQTVTEGNDDQGFWGLTVMSAAEYNFPNPPADQPQWLSLAQAVFNTQAARWDTQYCNGGLKWQIFDWNNGIDYKNSISQACFFALGARLGLYTGNQTYIKWAEKTWDWMIDVKFIDNETYAIYDGAHIEDNCKTITPYQFTYNAGAFILGAAALYNATEDLVWKDRLENLLVGANVFFIGPDKNIMSEVACESVNRCDLDEQSFKAYMSRWYAAITKWVPSTYDFVMPLLRASAVAAAEQCTGGDNQEMCGLRWDMNGTWDKTSGVGQQMAAVEVTLACMIKERSTAHTAHTGGTSKGNPGAGGHDIGKLQPGDLLRPINAGDKVGAAIVTILVVGAWVAGAMWMMFDETSNKTLAQQVKTAPHTLKAFIAGGAAAAAAAGAGAGILRKRDSSVPSVSEKKQATATDVPLDGSSNSSESDIQRPMSVVQVRSSGYSDHSRRLSNMPRGWPYIPSLRGSILTEPSGFMRPDSTIAEGAELKLPIDGEEHALPLKESRAIEDDHLLWAMANAADGSFLKATEDEAESTPQFDIEDRSLPVKEHHVIEENHLPLALVKVAGAPPVAMVENGAEPTPRVDSEDRSLPVKEHHVIEEDHLPLTLATAADGSFIKVTEDKAESTPQNDSEDRSLLVKEHHANEEDHVPLALANVAEVPSVRMIENGVESSSNSSHVGTETQDTQPVDKSEGEALPPPLALQAESSPDSSNGGTETPDTQPIDHSEEEALSPPLALQSEGRSRESFDNESVHKLRLELPGQSSDGDGSSTPVASLTPIEQEDPQTPLHDVFEEAYAYISDTESELSFQSAVFDHVIDTEPEKLQEEAKD